VHVLERDGRRPAVLHIHGYCQSSEYWTPTVERLAAAGRQAVAPDLPGFGASSGEPGPYTMEGYADTLASFVISRGLEPIVLVGGSMGGVVAQHLVLRHAQVVSRLLLVATGAYTADPVGALAKADLIASSSWSLEAVSPIVDGFFYARPPQAEMDRLRAIALQASQAAAVAAARSNASSRTLDRLGSIAIPTMIIQGRHDRSRTPEHGAEIRDRIAGARLEVIEGAGHTPHLEQPGAFHEIALPFLQAAS
jgi:pimeloyl-ACP methyl ester carboxylesterase